MDVDVQYYPHESGYCRNIFISKKRLCLRRFAFVQPGDHLDSIESDFQISRVMSTFRKQLFETQQRLRERREAEPEPRDTRAPHLSFYTTAPHLRPAFMSSLQLSHDDFKYAPAFVHVAEWDHWH